MKKIFVYLLSALILTLTACSWSPTGQQIPQEEDKNGTNLMNSGQKETGYQRELDDERTNTNQNPNFIDLSESRPNLDTDKDKVGEALKDYDYLELGPVLINGKNARVTVYSEKNLSQKEMKKLEKELHDKMVNALPRYRIQVNVEE
ncbi:hypothetical protein [Metabacillus arenae]|uniref:Sporulation protein n=1 Tax=Metabacillus arenae TaxID=2771434 RepID=A0A926RW88_9BACI|nr:hypothetical protein [Metabacillus arenae]MBD1379681.1 hypothetical protein [Metabacillus arenae]